MTKYLVAVLAATALLWLRRRLPRLDAVAMLHGHRGCRREAAAATSLVRDDGNSISFDTPGEDLDSGTDTLMAGSA